MESKLGATKFKKLIRETSVREYYVELKEDALTEQGFFNLEKVPGLRIAGAGQFLKKLRIDNCITLPKFAKIFKLNLNCVRKWENNQNKIPLRSLIKVAETNGISKNQIYSFIDQGVFKTKNSLPATFAKVKDIIHLFNPMLSTKGSGVWPIYVNTRLKKTLSEINSILNVEIVSTKTNKKLIYSKEFHNFLKTFFNYKEVLKIDPPLTSEVKRWFDMGVDLKRAIIIPCLQSDGGIDQYRNEIFFSGRSNILHNYFVDAMYYEYDLLPTSYFKILNKKNSDLHPCYLTRYNQNSVEEIKDEIMQYAGNTKTKPANGQTVEKYLQESQPHLKYLVNSSETEQKIAFRIWASTEGCIYIWRNSEKLVYPSLEIACAHPKLVVQLIQIANRFQISMIKRKSKRRWSGISGCCSFSLKTCTEFLKSGGFIKGVKVSAHSKYYEDIEKDVLTRGILEFKIRQKNNQKLRNLSLGKVHQEVNKIIKNKEYESNEFYVNYFS